jgi:hypothetical protein
MKKTILFAFTMLCLSINAQINPIIEIETGYYNRANSIILKNGSIMRDELGKFPIFANVVIGAKWKFITVRTYTLNMISEPHGETFTPGQVDYNTNVNVSYKSFELGYEHLCSHPIISNQPILKSYFRSSYDKIYLKIKIL